MARILIVEDEPKLAAVLADYLRAAGFEPLIAADGRLALQRHAQEAPDCVLLDLNLPGMDGMDVCREIRRSSKVPILMLTARADEIDRIVGLEIGADDYLNKPYSPREVVARVRALLRRSQGQLSTAGDGHALAQRQTVGGFGLDDAGQRAWWQEHALPLTPVEWRLLKTLLNPAGRVCSRAVLLDAMHDDFRDVSDRVVDSHVKNLRRKLQAAMPGLDVISTVYGAGYRLDLPSVAPRVPGDAARR